MALEMTQEDWRLMLKEILQGIDQTFHFYQQKQEHRMNLIDKITIGPVRVNREMEELLV